MKLRLRDDKKNWIMYLVFYGFYGCAPTKWLLLTLNHSDHLCDPAWVWDGTNYITPRGKGLVGMPKKLCCYGKKRKRTIWSSLTVCVRWHAGTTSRINLYMYMQHISNWKQRRSKKTEDSCRQRVMHLYGKAAKNVNQNEVERTVTNIRESLMKQENGSVVNDNMRAEFESRPIPKGVWGLGRHTPPPPPARATNVRTTKQKFSFDFRLTFVSGPHCNHSIQAYCQNA